jgi:hypothetical protein
MRTDAMRLFAAGLSGASIWLRSNDASASSSFPARWYRSPSVTHSSALCGSALM